MPMPINLPPMSLKEQLRLHEQLDLELKEKLEQALKALNFNFEYVEEFSHVDPDSVSVTYSTRSFGYWDKDTIILPLALVESPTPEAVAAYKAKQAEEKRLLEENHRLKTEVTELEELKRLSKKYGHLK